MTKQVLSIEQMQHLQELGLDTSNASMCWIKDTEGNQHFSVHDEYCYEASFMNPIPAYTLQDVLDLLPGKIKIWDERCWLCIDLAEQWIYYYSEFASEPYHEKIFDFRNGKELIDAAYEMLCWCIEKGYVETSKQDKS